MLILLLVHSLLAALLLRALVLGPRPTLWAIGFVLPLSGLVLTVGVAWSWVRLLPVLLALGVALHPERRALSSLPARLSLALLFSWALLVTLLVLGLDAELPVLMAAAERLGWGTAQTSGRHAVQLAVMVGNWLVLPLACLLAPEPTSARAAQSGFLAGCALSVLAGLYQATAQGMGLPWLPVDTELGALLGGHLGVRDQVELFSLGGGVQVARLYGLGGEPKHTAALTVVGVALLLSRLASGSAGRWDRGLLGLLVAGLFLTFSTSGWFALAATCAFFAVLAPVLAPAGALSAGTQRAALALGVVALGLAVGASLLDTDALGDIAGSRIGDRLSGGADTVSRYEPKDAAALRLLADHPRAALTGFGVGGADFFLIDYVHRDGPDQSNTITPTYLGVRLVAELGLVGLLLAGLVLWHVFRATPPAGRLFLGVAGPLALVQPAMALPALLFLAGVAVRPSPARP